jgi:hypothetical protein
MVPTDNAMAGILGIFDLVDVFPRVLRKGDMGASLRRVQSRDARLHLHVLIVFASNENAADFGLRARARMLSNLPENIGVDQDVGTL